ncbi:MAG: hypothetical protein FWD55_06785 [Propionibacteriaceae bacterium]|nr:hypothetical protein [Propionibacteriaceae bacterium]
MPKRISLAATMVLALVAALSGCTQLTAEDPPTVQTPQPDYDVWLISGTGIGPYVLGESYSLTEDPGEYPCSWTHFDEGDHGYVHLIDLENNHWDADQPVPDLTSSIISISWEGLDRPILPSFTAEGVGLGSTWDKVMDTYPDAVIPNSKYGEALMIFDSGVPIIFWFDPRDEDITPDDQVSVVYVGLDYVLSEMCG